MVWIRVIGGPCRRVRGHGSLLRPLGTLELCPLWNFENMTGLEITTLTLRLGSRTLIERLSLSISGGAVTTVMGPSGSGKSSLLAWLCGTLDPAFSVSGSMTLNGRRLDGLPPEQRRVGILFQDDLLFPHLSVGENLAFALPRNLRRRSRRQKVDEVLEIIELPGYVDHDPARLSGGQRARVALMRILLAEPEALLLDEPFSKLDQALRERFRTLVFTHACERVLPVLLVTHDPADAEAAAGAVIRIGEESIPT